MMLQSSCIYCIALVFYWPRVIINSTLGVFCVPNLCFGGIRAGYLNGISPTAHVNHSLHIASGTNAYHFNPVFIKPLESSVPGSGPLVRGSKTMRDDVHDIVHVLLLNMK